MKIAAKNKRKGEDLRIMYLKLIACKVLQREISSLLYTCRHTIDVTTMNQGYHDTPVILQKMLQKEIDRIDAQEDPHTNNMRQRDLDAILLGYGLCSNAVAGLKSSRYKMVVPRAHDCATLVMGSKERYQEYFDSCKGSYFFTKGWLELGAMPENEEEMLENKRKEYMEKYEDEDTVEYLLSIDRDMLKNYNCLTYVEWPELADADAEIRVKEMAKRSGWKYNYMEGSHSLLYDFLNGNWDEQRFLILEPGETLTPSYDENVMRRKSDKTRH